MRWIYVGVTFDGYVQFVDVSMFNVLAVGCFTKISGHFTDNLGTIYHYTCTTGNI